MQYRLQHFTAYQYASAVSQCHNEMRMAPRNSALQKVMSCEVTITPKPESYFERQDIFGNHVAYFNIRHSHAELNTLISSVVETFDPPEIPTEYNIEWEQALALLEEPTADNYLVQQYVISSPSIPANIGEIAGYARQSFAPNRKIIDALTELNHRIYTDFSYKAGVTNTSTPITEVFQKRQGVCQDFSHIAIACLRSLGFPAQYVSGYLETEPPPGKSKLVGADASHAWFSVYIPKIGWLDFDPTNNKQPDARYISVAFGRDYFDVAPLKGVVFGGGNHTLEVRVDMRPASEPTVIITGKSSQSTRGK